MNKTLRGFDVIGRHAGEAEFWAYSESESDDSCMVFHGYTIDGIYPLPNLSYRKVYKHKEDWINKIINTALSKTSGFDGEVWLDDCRVKRAGVIYKEEERVGLFKMTKNKITGYIKKAIKNFQQSNLNERSNEEKDEIIKNALIINAQESINKIKAMDGSVKDISDGYHTFKELYYHRMILFSVILHNHKDKSWKSWLHDDDTMFDDSFIVGIETPEGQYTYHYKSEYWDIFDVKALDRAPKYDGHKPSDITRLLQL